MAASATRYTFDELLALRDSPLVKKPDGLPSISQWMEYVERAFGLKCLANPSRVPVEQNGPRRKPQGSRVDDQYSTLDNGDQRPKLHTRQSTKTPGSGSYRNPPNLLD